MHKGSTKQQVSVLSPHKHFADKLANVVEAMTLTALPWKFKHSSLVNGDKKEKEETAFRISIDGLQELRV